MPSLDERTWLSDELWAQVRPPRARFPKHDFGRVLAVALVGALVWRRSGLFPPASWRVLRRGDRPANRLTVVLSLSDTAQVPVRVTGFRAAQPGARIVSARFNGVVSAGSVLTIPLRTAPALPLSACTRKLREQSPSSPLGSAQLHPRCESTSGHVASSATKPVQQPWTP